MGIEKTRILVHESLYWVNMNADTENTMEQCATFQEYQQRQQHENTIPYELPCELWEVVGADIFSINNNTLLCIADYHTKFSIMKKADALSADDLIREAKAVFTEFGIPKKVFSDAGTNFISELF